MAFGLAGILDAGGVNANGGAFFSESELQIMLSANKVSPRWGSDQLTARRPENNENNQIQEALGFAFVKQLIQYYIHS